MREWHTLIIATQSETPAIVHDAKAAGFQVSFVNCGAFSGELQERQWFIYATEDEFLRFMEWGQP